MTPDTTLTTLPADINWQTVTLPAWVHGEVVTVEASPFADERLWVTTTVGFYILELSEVEGLT